MHLGWGGTNIESVERMVATGGHRVHRIIVFIKPSLHARHALIEPPQ